MSDVTVVIPAKDESGALKDTIDGVRKLGYEALVVAAKGSAPVAEMCKREDVPFFFDSGGGKGVGLREAIGKVKTEYLVFIDADGSHHAEDIPMMIEKMKKENADMVIASRLQGGSMELYDGTLESFFRSLFTLGINQIVNLRFGSRITDTQNGFRAARVASLKKLGLMSRKFEIETEMVMKMLKRKMKILEVPSREEGRSEGKSGIIIWRHGWRYIGCVLFNLF